MNSANGSQPALAVREGVVHRLEQELAVREPGQRVVGRLVLLVEGDLAHLAHGVERDQQQRDEPRARLRGEHDQRRQRHDGGVA